MGYDLPKTVEIDGEVFDIRYDFRVALDIFSAINDPDLTDELRTLAVLDLFYVDFDLIANYQVAIDRCMWFLNGGKQEENTKQQPKLVDWEQDFAYIVAPINRVIGRDIRGIEYDSESNTGGFHWWTFLSAYLEIGDCLFAQIVRIRDKKARGKALDKTDREWYSRNRELVDIKHKYTDAELEFLSQWGGA